MLRTALQDGRVTGYQGKGMSSPGLRRPVPREDGQDRHHRGIQRLHRRSEPEMTTTTPTTTGSELRFYAEYQCFPTWVTVARSRERTTPTPTPSGSPTTWPMQVVAWSDAYDDLFDEDDFTAELFSSDAELRAFDDRGRELAQRVAQALRRPLRGALPLASPTRPGSPWAEPG